MARYLTIDKTSWFYSTCRPYLKIFFLNSQYIFIIIIITFYIRDHKKLFLILYALFVVKRALCKGDQRSKFLSCVSVSEKKWTEEKTLISLKKRQYLQWVKLCFVKPNVGFSKFHWKIIYCRNNVNNTYWTCYIFFSLNLCKLSWWLKNPKLGFVVKYLYPYVDVYCFYLLCFVDPMLC